MLLFAVSVLFYSGTLMKLDLLQFQALCFLKEKKLKRFKRPIIHLEFQFTAFFHYSIPLQVVRHQFLRHSTSVVNTGRIELSFVWFPRCGSQHGGGSFSASSYVGHPYTKFKIVEVTRRPSCTQSWVGFILPGALSQQGFWNANGTWMVSPLPCPSLSL